MLPPAAAEILTKSDFASQIGRHPAFVTRAIEQGKLSGEALVGEGRGTRIRVSEALRQLSIKLDLGQQLAQARPIIPLASQPAAISNPVASIADAGDDALADQRTEQLALRNAKLRAEIERGAREDAVAAGQLVDAAAVSRNLARQLTPLVSTFDELPAAIAKPLSEQFGLAYPDVLIAVRSAIRKTRTAWADRVVATGRVSGAPVAG